jgi:hypothetical protein
MRSGGPRPYFNQPMNAHVRSHSHPDVPPGSPPPHGSISASRSADARVIAVRLRARCRTHRGVSLAIQGVQIASGMVRRNSWRSAAASCGALQRRSEAASARLPSPHNLRPGARGGKPSRGPEEGWSILRESIAGAGHRERSPQTAGRAVSTLRRMTARAHHRARTGEDCPRRL